MYSEMMEKQNTEINLKGLSLASNSIHPPETISTSNRIEHSEKNRNYEPPSYKSVN